MGGGAASNPLDAARPPGGWRPLDAALALLLLVLLVTEIVPNPDMTPRVPLTLLSVGLTVPLAWRRAFPATVGVIVCASHLISSAISTGDFAPQLAILPVLVALYTASSRTRGNHAIAIGGVTALLTVAAWVVTDEGRATQFWPWMLWAGAWASGTFVRRREEVAAHHAARAAALEVEARTAAAESAQAERDRIARELHDVVAHAVSVMVVQAGAERLRLGRDAGPTGAVLTAIEESGRTALAELRTMLGLLRDGSEEPLAPLPGVASISGLVDRLRSAGLPVDVTCRPSDLLERDPVSGSAAGLAAYRIIQEALTNVVRHAGLVPTTVEVELAGDELRLAVTNTPKDPAHGRTGASGGRGLIGMRERAAALGGTFDARERDGGYVVTACLPVAAAGAWT